MLPILTGIVLFVLGLVLMFGWLDWILDLSGIILVVIGIALAVYGFATRNKRSSTGF